MSGLVDSAAVFVDYVKKVGLEDKMDVFRARNWTTLAGFAFASSYTPGAPDDTKFIADVVTPPF